MLQLRWKTAWKSLVASCHDEEAEREEQSSLTFELQFMCTSVVHAWLEIVVFVHILYFCPGDDIRLKTLAKCMFSKLKVAPSSFMQKQTKKLLNTVV